MRPVYRRVVVPVLLLALAALCSLTPLGAGPIGAPAAAARPLAKASQPNIVLIMTDDMALSDLRWMPKTRKLLGRAGMTFRQGIAPNPMCCPARATVLTGQESHNNGVWSNGGPHGGYQALPSTSQLPQWLKKAGYRTAFLGKHLNGFNATHAREERGWDVLDGLVRGVYSYRSFATWDNGRMNAVKRGYVTNYLTQKTRTVIKRFERKDRAPFFTWVNHVGPHKARKRRCNGRGCWSFAVPHKSDEGDFARVASPSRRLPSYNHRNDTSKPPFLRGVPRVKRSRIDAEFQARIEALQSVDRSVADTVQTLRKHGELRRTLLMFTSDHGYLLGQHRYVGKRLPYEEALRVPLVVRGPGVRAGRSTGQLTTTADLTRTIVDLAGARAPYELDGASMVPALRGAGVPTRTSTILQSGAAVADEGDDSGLDDEPSERGWLYRGYRDGRYTYARYPDPAGDSTAAFEELYDRRRDPHQLDNLAQRAAYGAVLEEARHRSRSLGDCSGASCHQWWPSLTAPR